MTLEIMDKIKCEHWFSGNNSHKDQFKKNIFIIKFIVQIYC